MEPAFRRGDLVILNNRDIFGEPGVGDVVVYNVAGRDIPIVHRVVRKFGKGYVDPMSSIAAKKAHNLANFSAESRHST